jgi:hypothetical protein
MCVYGNAEEPPSAPCREHADCNVDDEARFSCVDARCEVATSFVLSRSMCSRRCESDADCDDSDRSTACSTGFGCARIQSLGDFCCAKLCVCRDDLDEASADAREQACATSELTGCCDQDPVPAACGR